MFMPIAHCNCELQKPFTVFMQAWFRQYTAGHAGHIYIYMCVHPKWNRVPDLLKTNSGAAMVPPVALFGIAFMCGTVFFFHLPGEGC